MTISIRRLAATAAAVALLGMIAFGLAQAAGPRTTPAGAPFGAPRAAAPALATDATTTATGAELSLAGDLDAILAADQAAPVSTVAGARGPAAGPLRRLAAARQLVHATVVLDLPKTGLTTVQIDHGTISAVGATSLTIAETGGGKPSVTLESETRVRRNGAKAAIADLKVGDEVFVLSKVETGGTVAYLVVVPKSKS
jgi:hypothetical protein